MQQNVELIELNLNDLQHLEMMYSVRTHPLVAMHLRKDPPTHFAAHVNYLNHIGSNKKFYLIQADSSLCGYCQFDILEQKLEIGISIHPDFCNRGIGTLALPLFLQKIKKLDLTKNKPITLFVKKDNLRAIALYTKCGFKHVGDANEHGEYFMKKTDVP